MNTKMSTPLEKLLQDIISECHYYLAFGLGIKAMLVHIKLTVNV